MRMLCVPLVALYVAGCAATLESHVDDTRASLSDRTGRHIRAYSDSETLDVELSAETMRLLARPLDAATAVQVALLTNRRIDEAYEAIGVGRAALIQATLVRNPHAEGELLFHGDDEPTLVLEATQSLSSVLTLPWRRGAADAELDATKQAVVGRVLDVALAVREALIRHVADRQLLALRHDVLVAADASREAAQLLHDAGNTTALDFATKRALYEDARIAVSEAEARMAESREALQALMGLPARASQWRTIERLPDPPATEPGDLARIVEHALGASTELAESRARIRGAGRRLGLAHVDGLVPELSVGVAAERHAGQTELGPRVEVSIPLFDAGYGRAAAADAELRRLRHGYVATSIDVRASARTARLRLLAARTRALWARDSLLPLRHEIVAQTQLEYNAMQVGVFQLLAARRDEIDASRMYVEALRDYWIARARVEQVIAGRMPLGSGAAVGSSDGVASGDSGSQSSEGH